MPNKNYVAGRRFEWDLMKVMKLKGFKCIRASGSHGEYDIIAYRVDQKPLFVQCKVTKTPKEGERLLKKFKEETVPSKYYHQQMAVKAGRGMVHLMEVTV